MIRAWPKGWHAGKRFATDASIIKAYVRVSKRVPGEEPIDWGNPDEATRPVREYLARWLRPMIRRHRSKPFP